MARGKAKAKAKTSRVPGRPLWRGHLRLSLVNCPVAMYNAITESDDIHFHWMNPETGHRARMKMVDGETGEELERSELVKGYEFQKDRYVTLTTEEINDVKIESSSVMNIEQFVPRDDLDARYFERFYYIIPDGEAGEEAFTVIRKGMEKTGTYAITRAVISRKERVVALKPCDKGIMGYALREASDIRNTDSFFDDIEDPSVDKDMLDVAMQLIKKNIGEFDPDKYEDRYEARLRDMINAKLKGIDLEEEPEAEAPNVVNLMDALKRSLKGEKPERKAAKDDDGEQKSATVHKLQTKSKTKAAHAKKPAAKKAPAKKRKAS